MCWVVVVGVWVVIWVAVRRFGLRNMVSGARVRVVG